MASDRWPVTGGRQKDASGTAHGGAGREPATGHRSPATPSSSSLVTLSLKSGKDRPVRLGHPWIFSGAIRALDPGATPGSVVRVCAADGTVLGTGYVNPRCDIAVRLLSRADEPIDAGFVARRVIASLALRARVVGSDSSACRLINGEGDRLPGLVVDRFDDVLVLQCLTAGMERLKPLVIAALLDHLGPRAIVERSEGGVRAAEGLAPLTASHHGDPPAEVIARENGQVVAVAPGAGQKTGYYCDQRPNRALVRQLAAGRRVLDAFAYSGGFALHAGAGGAAHVTAVESSTRALGTARRNWLLNGLPEDRGSFVEADVAAFLRRGAESFDLLVLDPPPLVRQRKDLARGARAYKDLNLWAMRRAARDALLLTFTCSQHVDGPLFRKIVSGAAADAGRAVQVLQHLGPGPDHPAALAHSEGEYLHGLLLRIA